MASEAPKADERGREKGGDPLQEIAKYEEVMARDPKSRAFALLAEAYRKNGQFAEAVKTAQEGLKVHQFYLSGRVALARAFFDSGKLAEAGQEFEKVIAAAPDNLMAHRHLAEIYASRGLRTEAAKSLKMVVLLDPGDHTARERLISIGDMSGEPESRPPEGESLIERHRYDEAFYHRAGPSPEAPSPTLPTLTVEEMIHQPELSRRSPEEIPPPAEPAAAENLAAILEEAPSDIPALDLEMPSLEEPAPVAAEALEPAPAPPEIAPEEEGPAAPAEAPSWSAIEISAEPPPSEAPAAPSWEGVMEEVIVEEQAPSELTTETLADLYIQQGFYDKALGMYRALVDEHPDEARLRQKYEELNLLRKLQAGGPRASPSSVSGAAPKEPDREDRIVATLKTWLERVRANRR